MFRGIPGGGMDMVSQESSSGDELRPEVFTWPSLSLTLRLRPAVIASDRRESS